jgi:hypothetical protein
LNNKKAKAIRKVGQKAFDNSARTAVMTYVDRICTMPFKRRALYCWYFLQGKNPHTKEKP